MILEVLRILLYPFATILFVCIYIIVKATYTFESIYKKRKGGLNKDEL